MSTNQYIQLGSKTELITTDEAQHIAALLSRAAWDCPGLRDELNLMVDSINYRIGQYKQKIDDNPVK